VQADKQTVRLYEEERMDGWMKTMVLRKVSIGYKPIEELERIKEPFDYTALL
jgi:hypothetical protein